jgi:hypothetical protein
MTTIHIAQDFARYPFGRYRTDGPYSGQRFREEFLMPALQQDDEEVAVVLDGAIGMGSSFLEEAFGGLVREGFDRDVIRRRIKIVSSRDETLSKEIFGYVSDADAPRHRAMA